MLPQILVEHKLLPLPQRSVPNDVTALRLSKAVKKLPNQTLDPWVLKDFYDIVLEFVVCFELSGMLRCNG